MLYLKKLSKALIYSIVLLLGITLIVTILNYAGIINSKFVNIFKYITPIVSFIIGGIIIGKNSNNKGWFEGIKFSLINVMILTIINLLIFKNYNIILYIIVLISSILGSIIGINLKKQ